MFTKKDTLRLARCRPGWKGWQSFAAQFRGHTVYSAFNLGEWHGQGLSILCKDSDFDLHDPVLQHLQFAGRCIREVDDLRQSSLQSRNASGARSCTFGKTDPYFKVSAMVPVDNPLTHGTPIAFVSRFKLNCSMFQEVVHGCG
jgi:hypothetical protein